VDLKNMLQRRIDDPLKRRNVQRSDPPAPVVQPMAEMIVMLIGKWPGAMTQEVSYLFIYSE
jgi:hypothetical protein